MSRVLITGGSKGIGRGISALFASKGCHVISVDLDKHANNELESLYPNNIKCFDMDICDANTSEYIINYMTNEFNGIDILINNAAVQLSNGTGLHEFDENIWNRVLQTNLNSYFLFSKYSIKQMLKQYNKDNNPFNIINMCSVQGSQSEKGVCAYAASKGAVLSLTKQMALEYAPKIRVNAISPV